MLEVTLFSFWRPFVSRRFCAPWRRLQGRRKMGTIKDVLTSVQGGFSDQPLLRRKRA